LLDEIFHLQNTKPCPNFVFQKLLYHFAKIGTNSRKQQLSSVISLNLSYYVLNMQYVYYLETTNLVLCLFESPCLFWSLNYNVDIQKFDFFFYIFKITLHHSVCSLREKKNFPLSKTTLYSEGKNQVYIHELSSSSFHSSWWWCWVLLHKLKSHIPKWGNVRLM